MEWYYYMIVSLVGVVTGAINVLAGGGSLIMLPLLISMGLPPAVANGTNRVGLLVQTMSGIVSFKKQGVSNFRFSLMLSVVAIVGAVIGVQVAIDMSDVVFKRVLAVIMVLVLVSILWRRKKSKKRIQIYDEYEGSIKAKIILCLVFFCVGFYGGFIQAGVGFIIMAALTRLTRFDLIRINAIKIFVVFCYMLVSLGLFMWYDKVNWLMALALGLGTGVGGWLGAVIGVKKGEKIVKVILTVAVLGFVVKLLWF